MTAIVTTTGRNVCKAYDEIKTQLNNNDEGGEQLQQELRYYVSAIKEISRESSWSSDVVLWQQQEDFSLDNNNEIMEVTKWMDRKEREVMDYYTLLMDVEKTKKRSGDSKADGEGSRTDREFLKAMEDGVLQERRRLRVVMEPEEEDQTPSPPQPHEDMERELGKGVGMKRTDPRAVGRFKQTSGRYEPPGSRERESAGGSGSDNSDDRGGSRSSGLAPKEIDSMAAGANVQTSVSLSTSGKGRPVPSRYGVRSSHSDDSPKALASTGAKIQTSVSLSTASEGDKGRPATWGAGRDRFPNAVYIKEPPAWHAPKVEEHDEECYYIEELEAMGITVKVSHDEDEEKTSEDDEHHDEADWSPIRRWDGTILNRKPGSRRSLQWNNGGYTYWRWGGSKSAKSSKTEKSAKEHMVYYVAQQPPQTQVVLPSSSGGWGWGESKSSKSKSSKIGKVTKSGKPCIALLPPTGPDVCGMNLADAGSKCNATCASDSDCPGMETCIENVQACAATTPSSSGYCGTDMDDAMTTCDVACTSDVVCPTGQTCFLNNTVVEQCNTGGGEGRLGYCGVVDANGNASTNCTETCSDDGMCPTGETCFLDSAVVDECSSKFGYCGTDVEDASKCNDACVIDTDCPSGETCFPASAVGECTSSKPGYCGADLDDAAKCAVPCGSDGDCPSGESCFTDAGECKPGHCGTDEEDASKCATPCSSDAGCPSGESCFNDVECVVEPRCPTGCKDCDPDSPLPCPNPRMKQVCDKNNNELYPPGDPKAGQRISNFKDCYNMCKPSFCCIHSSTSKKLSPSCSKEYENCPLYYPCYIIWWKLHDTIGPATYLRVEQKEPFFNVKLTELEEDFKADPTFFNQLFGHHFDTDDPLTDDLFEDENNW